jgi:hypothetical protein
LTTEIGEEVAFTDVTVEVLGQNINAITGNEDVTGNAIVPVTGSDMTADIGDIIPVSTYSVTGSSLTTAIGSVSPQANANVIVTGSRLTTNIGTVQVTAWAEVNTGVNVTWTPVDLAA